MDILAAMLAYLMSVAGIVGAMAIAVFVFLSPPSQRLPAEPSATASALVVQPSSENTAATKHISSAAIKPRPNPVTTIAEDVRQNPQTSARALRRLAEKERVKRLAFRERSDFETRFLKE